MKQLLLLVVMTAVVTGLQAQKNRNKQEQKTTGYAITAVEKGGKSWKEVRFVNMITGEELKSIYQSSQETQPLNARTGKPIVTTESKTSTSSTTNSTVTVRKVVDLDQELDKMNHNGRHREVVIVKHTRQPIQMDKPFATNSAAAAYDKKHERLYYTPMGINQLRYIDLKSGKIYFFEDEPFGTVKGLGDSPKQITRMVIASDGNGYALTNDANNLIRFTTGKKPEITDLGALTDDAANGRYSVHSSGSGFGGDIIADASGNLYLFTANRNIFKISIESKVATYKGKITGLPQGFSTNGAMVEADSKVIVASSESTVGYFRVDLNTLQAEMVSTQGIVFNASDLANGNLAFEKQKKEKKQKEVKEQPAVVTATASKNDESLTARSTQADAGKGSVTVYPNPVTDGFVKLIFDQPVGQYQVHLLDISGKLIGTKTVNVGYSGQVEEFSFPELSVKGSYLIKVTSELNKVNVVNKIVVQ